VAEFFGGFVRRVCSDRDLSCSGGEKEGDFCCGEGIGNF
jgi:hypothetical protein